MVDKALRVTMNSNKERVDFQCANKQQHEQLLSKHQQLYHHAVIMHSTI